MYDNNKHSDLSVVVVVVIIFASMSSKIVSRNGSSNSSRMFKFRGSRLYFPVFINTHFFRREGGVNCIMYHDQELDGGSVRVREEQTERDVGGK